MSAETLRRAAALMRERAEGSTAGPWKAVEQTHGEWFGLQSQWTALGTAFEQTEAEHIASWHPAVALAVAEVLTFAAETWTDGRCNSSRGWDETCGECDNCTGHWAQVRALAAARAYLGSDS